MPAVDLFGVVMGGNLGLHKILAAVKGAHVARLFRKQRTRSLMLYMQKPQKWCQTTWLTVKVLCFELCVVLRLRRFVSEIGRAHV